MKNIIAMTVLGLAWSASDANAQPQPNGTGGAQFLPNFYNQNSQPLSPYLNLLRGGNPAVNYFYGVRPGSQQGAFGSPFLGSTGSMIRPSQFPQIDTIFDADTKGPQDGLRPTGHPFAFNNTLGFYGPLGGGSGQRPGATGPSRAGAKEP